MCDIQDNLLDYKCDDVQGEDLLDQSADFEGKPIKEDIIIVEDV